MTTTGIIAMIAIAGFVWGGLALILATAIRKERAKRTGAEGGGP
ncbi:MAG: hypothetical protein ACRELC_13795 [Gemmatimonadota bacterium]